MVQFGRQPSQTWAVQGKQSAAPPPCAHRDLLVNCTKVKSTCFTGICLTGSNCNHSVCVV